MAISFQCECGRKLSARDEQAGRSARCPACSTVLKIPIPQAESRAESEDTYALEETSTPAPPSPPASGPTAVAPKIGATIHGTSPGPDFDPSRDRQSAAALPRGDRRSSTREYLYVALFLGLIPLVFSLLGPKETSFQERLDATMQRAGADTIARVQALETREDAGLDDLLKVLPEGKLDATAHLPRATWVHWLYGAVAAACFWIFTLLLFHHEKRTPHHLLLVGLFTGTCGIVLLLGFQVAASATQGVWLRGRSVILIVFYIVKFIGWSYASAGDPDSNLLLSFVGFTCGVGLCEELCKALPLLGYYRRDARMGWRGAALWGLASGAGFGVAEGIMYSTRYYNGIAPLDMYVVRFVSCVALHAIWTASVGITMERLQETIQGDLDWTTYSLAILRILAVPMVLHGMYDTLLKKDLQLWALAVGVATFAWFAVQVEMARGRDAETQGKRRAALV